MNLSFRYWGPGWLYPAQIATGYFSFPADKECLFTLIILPDGVHHTGSPHCPDRNVNNIHIFTLLSYSQFDWVQLYAWKIYVSYFSWRIFDQYQIFFTGVARASFLVHTGLVTWCLTIYVQVHYNTNNTNFLFVKVSFPPALKFVNNSMVAALELC